MKILAFVDVHDNKAYLKKIKKKSEFADLIVCAGDISNFGLNLNKLLKDLNSFGKKVLIIPGNHETDHELKKLCKKYRNLVYLHKRSFREKGILFLGYGGSGFSIEDPEFDALSKKFKKIVKKKDRIILITHAPVYGTKLDYLLWLKEHRGNASLRRFIEQVRPLWVICGHFHENDSKADKIGNTKIINPGKQGKLLRIKIK